MTTTEFVAYLRAVADFYESHPDITTLPFNVAYMGDGLGVYVDTKEELTKLGSFEKRFVNERMVAFVPLSEITGWNGKKKMVGLEFSIPRQQVCTKRVVGTRIVSERYVKGTEGYLEPEHEEEIVEWDCAEPILGDASGDNKVDNAIGQAEQAVEKVETHHE